MKKPPTVVVVLLIAVCQLSVPSLSNACMVTVTLWSRIGDADVVVLARVSRVDHRLPRPGGYMGTLGDSAVLEVIDTWKGSAPRELRVEFLGAVPSDYAEGTTVVAFVQEGDRLIERQRVATAAIEEWLRTGTLPEGDGQVEAAAADAPEDVMVDESAVPSDDLEINREPDMTPEQRQRAIADAESELRGLTEWAAGRWIAVDYYDPSGSLLARGGDVAALGELVRSAADLQSHDGGRVSQEDRRAWLVDAVEHPALRVESLDELVGFKDALTDEELGRLAGVFLNQPALNRSDVAMLRVLARRPDTEVDRTAASVVEAALRMEPIPDWATPMVEETLSRYGDDLWQRVGRDDRDPVGKLVVGPTGDTLPTLWAVARRDLGIPEVPPAEPPPGRRNAPSAY